MEIIVLMLVSWLIQISINLYNSFQIIKPSFLLLFFAIYMTYVISCIIALFNIGDIKIEILKLKDQLSKEYIQKINQINISFFSFVYKSIDFFVKNKQLKNENLQDINKDLVYFRRLFKLNLILLSLFLIMPSKKLLLLVASYFILNQDIVKNFLINLF